MPQWRQIKDRKSPKTETDWTRKVIAFVVGSAVAEHIGHALQLDGIRVCAVQM
jgi:hypothetical protein